MNNRQSQYIVTTYECGSISNAAKKLYISQPALSQAIQIVEREIGTKIFDRSTTPISLTYAGEKYMATVRQMLELEANLTRQLQEILHEEGGRLRVGISTLRGAAFLPRILSQFLELHPRVDIEIIEAGTARMDELLMQGKADLAFLLTINEDQQDLHYITLCQERMVLYAGKSTAIAQKIPPFTEIDIKLAEDETFISLKPGHGVRTMQDHIFFENGISPKILLETESVVLARNLAMACNLVTLYPETLMDLFSPASEDEIYYPIQGKQYTREFYLCHKKRTYLPKYMQDFIEITKSLSFTSKRRASPKPLQEEP